MSNILVLHLQVFFLGEYANILLMSSLFVIFFLGGGSIYIFNINFLVPNYIIISSLTQEFFFAIKTIIIVFLFIFIRANLPRFRFDQLMHIGWKIFLPLSLSFIFFISGILIAFNALNIIQLPLINLSNNYIQSFLIFF